MELKQLLSKKEIENPVLRSWATYTAETEIQFLFAVLVDGVQKGIFLATKDGKHELQTKYSGSHYLLETAIPLYNQALQEAIAHLS